MKVKIFDESHEKDLEEEINKFIKEKDIEIIVIDDGSTDKSIEIEEE